MLVRKIILAICLTMSIPLNNTTFCMERAQVDSSSAVKCLQYAFKGGCCYFLIYCCDQALDANLVPCGEPLRDLENFLKQGALCHLHMVPNTVINTLYCLPYMKTYMQEQLSLHNLEAFTSCLNTTQFPAPVRSMIGLVILIQMASVIHLAAYGVFSSYYFLKAALWDNII